MACRMMSTCQCVSFCLLLSSFPAVLWLELLLLPPPLDASQVLLLLVLLVWLLLQTVNLPHCDAQRGMHI